MSDAKIKSLQTQLTDCCAKLTRLIAAVRGYRQADKDLQDKLGHGHGKRSPQWHKDLNEIQALIKANSELDQAMKYALSCEDAGEALRKLIVPVITSTVLDLQLDSKSNYNTRLWQKFPDNDTLSEDISEALNSVLAPIMDLNYSYLHDENKVV